MATRADLKDTIAKLWSAVNHLNAVEIHPDISNDLVNSWREGLLGMQTRVWTASIELEGRTVPRRTPSIDSLSSLASSRHSALDAQSPTDDKQLRNIAEWAGNVEVSPVGRPATSSKSSSLADSAHPALYSPNTTQSPTAPHDLLASTGVAKCIPDLVNKSKIRRTNPRNVQNRVSKRLNQARVCSPRRSPRFAETVKKAAPGTLRTTRT